MWKHSLRIAVVVVAATTSACGGGAGTPIDARAIDARSPDAAPDTIAVRIVAPTMNQVMVGSRAVSVSGTLTAAGDVTAVMVGDGTTMTAATFNDTSFGATIMLGNNTNMITVAATDALGGTGSAQVTVSYPFVALPDFDPASIVIGQTTATVGTQRTSDATTLKNPTGNPAQIGNVLYVNAIGENRVLGYNVVPSASGASADFVLGQTAFTGTTASGGATGLSLPSSAATDGTALLVADHGNNRVLIWSAPPTVTDAPPNVVLGEPDMTTATGGCTSSLLTAPLGIVAAGGKVVVADSNNNRIMIWSAMPTANGAAADLVLGQGDFTHCKANDDNQDGTQDTGPTGRTLNSPIGVWSDGTRLFVADSSNNRVLIWTTFPTASFQPADLVLGQTTMTQSAVGLTSATMSSPQFVTSNGNQLALTDTNNNRILIWDALPAASATAADHVLGQADFTHGKANDDNQDGTADTTPTARTLSTPRGVLFLGDALLATDISNNRALIYSP